MGILEYLKLPEAREGLNIDSDEALALHRKIIQDKPFLRRLYVDFYREFLQRLPPANGARKVIELGSGAGFIKEVIPGVITSDVRISQGVDVGFSAEKMSFKEKTVDAFLLLNVFHHFAKPLACLREMSRCLRHQGKIILIEPANTPWRRWVDRRCHTEVFDVHGGWELPPGGPMSAANIALAWIVFCRDLNILEEKLPEIVIKDIRLHMPFRYILSGGLTYRQLLPSFAYPGIKWLEACLSPFNPWLAGFQTIELEKR